MGAVEDRIRRAEREQEVTAKVEANIALSAAAKQAQIDALQATRDAAQATRDLAITTRTGTEALITSLGALQDKIADVNQEIRTAGEQQTQLTLKGTRAARDSVNGLAYILAVLAVEGFLISAGIGAIVYRAYFSS